MNDQQFLSQAIELAKKNVEAGGRPFGALVVKAGKVVGQGVNQILERHDPTAHAELLALRDAGKTLAQVRLDDCIVYASGQPCPMCLAAMRMAGVTRAIYAYSNADAEPFGLSTAKIAAELRHLPEEQAGFDFIQLKPLDKEDQSLYKLWQRKQS